MAGASFLRGGEVGVLPVAGRLRQGGIEPAGLGPLAVMLVVGQVASQFAQRGAGSGGFGAPAVAEGDMVGLEARKNSWISRSSAALSG